MAPPSNAAPQPEAEAITPVDQEQSHRIGSDWFALAAPSPGTSPPNGSTWSKVDGITYSPALPTKVYVGFALTAHNNTAFNVATIDKVRASGAVTPINAPPQIALTAPVRGGSHVSPGTVSLQASASDADGSVAKVEFFDGAVKLGETSVAPFALLWRNPDLGPHTLSARATDNLGAATASTAVNISVTQLALGTPTFTVGNGTLQFQFPGQNGTSYVIEASSDLRQWSPITTNVVVNGQVQFTDPLPAVDRRFYRVRLWP